MLRRSIDIIFKLEIWSIATGKYIVCFGFGIDFMTCIPDDMEFSVDQEKILQI